MYFGTHKCVRVLGKPPATNNGVQIDLKFNMTCALLVVMTYLVSLVPTFPFLALMVM